MSNKLHTFEIWQAGDRLQAASGGSDAEGSPCAATTTAGHSETCDDELAVASCPLCAAPIALDRSAGPQPVHCRQCGLYCELAPPAPAAPPEIQLPMVENEPEPTDEFQRWLAGKPIQLRPPGRLERLQQWRREQPALAVVAAAAFFLLAATTVAALGTSAWLHVQLNLQRRTVTTCEQQAETARADLERQVLIARSSTRAAEARYAQAQRETKLVQSSHLAWRSTQVGEQDVQQAVKLATESLTMALEASAHPPALAHQNLRRIAAGDDGKLLRGHTRAITALAASPDGRWLASGSDDATVRLWPLADQTPSRSGELLSGHLRSIAALAFTSDGRWLASAGGDSTIRFWDLTAADPAHAAWMLRAKSSQITAVAVSGDNRWAAVAARGAGGEESTLRVWDLSSSDTGDVSIEATCRDGAIESLAISPDSRWLLTAGDGRIVRLWKLADERPLAKSIALAKSKAPIRAAAFTPGGWLVAAGAVDESGNAAYVWGLNGESPSAPIVLGGYAGDVRSIDVSRDGRWLATAGDDAMVRVWDLHAQNPAACGISLSGHTGQVGAVKISPDGRWIASGGHDRTVRLWSLTSDGPDATPVVLRRHSHQISALAISADGRWLASAADDELRLWTLKLDQLMVQAQRRSVEVTAQLAAQNAAHVAAAKPALPATITSLPPVPVDNQPPLAAEPAMLEQADAESVTGFSTFLR